MKIALCAGGPLLRCDVR